ncbi:thioredoxin [mine drainage metagenome]|uniref:Thioredoxin n=1 Tax=mine drainage metagenome TaxID=410659 RepID=A0A1J5P5L1_9ZZZZ
MYMRQRVKIGFIVLILFTVVLLGYKTISKFQFLQRVALNTVTIPQFTFETLQRQNFGKQNIKDSLGNVIIMLFSPDCDHCQYMAHSLVKNNEKIKKIQFLMVTPFADGALVNRFGQTYGLNALPNVQLLIDTKGDFPKIFGTAIVPSFYVYKGNKLIKSIKGETKIQNLLTD